MSKDLMGDMLTKNLITTLDNLMIYKLLSFIIIFISIAFFISDFCINTIERSMRQLKNANLKRLKRFN